MSKPTIGFIGLGLLGGCIARRYASSGFTVVGHDIDGSRCGQAATHGIRIVASAAEVACASDIVGICVTTTQAVAEVIEGASGIASIGRTTGKVVIDHSTTEIGVTRRVAAHLAERTGLPFIDAPLSGGPEAALAGTLAIMAGGDKATVEQLRPVLETLGRFTHMGPTGAGQATKLVNQTLVLANYCVMAEAFRLAEAYDVDAAQIPHALATGHAGSNLLPVLFGRMVARDWTPTGYARQVLKDLEMLNDAAHDKQLAMPMAAQAMTLFRMLCASGKSELDGASIATLWPERG